MADVEIQERGTTDSKKKAKNISIKDVFSVSQLHWDGKEDDGGFTADKGGDVAAWDPLMVLGAEIMITILNRLDARSVALARSVCTGWLDIASSESIWATKCEELWLGKAHIPRVSKVRGLPNLTVYSLSVMDGKRSRITRSDLCEHIWEFRFSEAAPDYWRNLDPHWTGSGTPMLRYFHPDGSISADPEDKVWGGHESCYTVVTGLLHDDKVREHYVRINRWPKMSVKRKQNWGWELSNHLYCYSSVPDADKKGGTGPLLTIF